MRYSQTQIKQILGTKTKKSSLVTSAYRSNVKGWRTVGGKKYYFKSLWEIQYATYLQFLKDKKQLKDWVYEPEIFSFPKEAYKASPFYYCPDFKVIEMSGKVSWHEVKGYLTPDAKKKHKRFLKHYPDEQLVIIDKVWFKNAHKMHLDKLISWEKLNP